MRVSVYYEQECVEVSQDFRTFDQEIRKKDKIDQGDADLHLQQKEE